VPFPLIPLLISAIGGISSVVASRIRAVNVGGQRGFVSGPIPMGTALPLPPIISRVGGVIADVAGAAAGAFLGSGPATMGPPAPLGGGVFPCPPRAVRVPRPCFVDACGNRVTAEGCPIPKRRRRRGITATELRGFNKVNVLLNKVGKEPRKPRARR